MSRLHFPDRPFRDLFTKVTPPPTRPAWIYFREAGTPFVIREAESERRNPSGVIISEYMTISGYEHPHGSMYVAPTRELSEFIWDNMVAVDYDRIYFKATVRTNGIVLLSAHYNQILGGRWLTTMPLADFPQ